MMISKERKQLIEREAELLRTKDVRRPIYNIEFAFVIFAALFVGALFGAKFPIWLSVGLIPILVFGFAFYRCSAAQREFDSYLEESE